MTDSVNYTNHSDCIFFSQNGLMKGYTKSVFHKCAVKVKWENTCIALSIRLGTCHTFIHTVEFLAHSKCSVNVSHCCCYWWCC